MEIREDVRKKLIEVAERGENNTITYKELMDKFGIPRGNPNREKSIGGVLGKISEYEVSEGRPMLSAIAIKTGTGTKRIGDGFFPLARKLERLKSEDRKGEQAFLDSEQKKVWKQYKK